MKISLKSSLDETKRQF